MPITLDGTLGITTPSLTTDSFVNNGAESIGGNLTFTTAGSRITGDMSNATATNRLAFQSSTTNGATILNLLPNGTSTTAYFAAFNNSDPTNASTFQLLAGPSDSRLNSNITGTGTYTPMTFYTGGSERMRIDTSGNVGIGTASPSGYRLNLTTPSGTSPKIALTQTSWRTWSMSVGASPADPALIFSDESAALERMRIDSSGNVGIGTTNPTSLLTVYKSASNAIGPVMTLDNPAGGGLAAGSAIYFACSGFVQPNVATITALDDGAFSANLIFSTKITGATGNALAERMRIDGSGNVLIGTTSKFGTSKVTIQTSGSDPDYGLTVYSPSTTNGAVIRLADNLYNAAIRTAPSGGATNLAFDVSGFERMRIDSSGNAGIGTSSPVNRLTVSLNGLQNDNLGMVQAIYPGTNGAYNTSFTTKNYHGTGQFMQWTQNGMRIGNRINTNGGVGSIYFTYANDQVGPCIDGANGYFTSMNGGVNYANITTNTFYTSNGVGAMHLYNDYNANVTTLRITRYPSDGDGVTFFQGTSQKGYITIASGGTTYNSLSDYRLKENINPQVGALDRVMALNPVSFTWKESGKVDEGFIAHELQAVIPGAVQGKKDELDDEGNPRYQGVDQARIVSVLVKAVQELKAEVDSLKQQLGK